MPTDLTPLTPGELRAWRTDRGLTQQELADLLGIHRVTVSRMETGELPLGVADRLALEGLGARLDDHTGPQTTSRRG